MNVSIGSRWETFVEETVRAGCYGSASEVVREGLHLVEERKAKLVALRFTVEASIVAGGEVLAKLVVAFVVEAFDGRLLRLRAGAKCHAAASSGVAMGASDAGSSSAKHGGSRRAAKACGGERRPRRPHPRPTGPLIWVLEDLWADRKRKCACATWQPSSG